MRITRKQVELKDTGNNGDTFGRKRRFQSALSGLLGWKPTRDGAGGKRRFFAPGLIIRIRRNIPVTLFSSVLRKDLNRSLSNYSERNDSFVGTRKGLLH